MAKKKKNEDLSIDDLIKKFGVGVFQDAATLKSTKGGIIPLSPALDMILGGGVPFGSVVRLTGDPKCGKTLSSLCLARNAQQLDERAYVVYLNIEGRIKRRDLDGIQGLDQSEERFKMVGSYYDEETGKGKILSAEEYLEIAEWYIKNRPYTIIIVDSISMLTTRSELDAEIGDDHYSPGPRLMSKFTKRNSNAIAVNNIVLIGITHKTTKMSGYGGTTETGGRKIQYASDVALDALYTQDWNIGEDNKIGQVVHWRTSSTALNASPGQKCESYIRYGYGIDEYKEIWEIGKACGFIDAGGSWFTFSFMKDHLDVLGVEDWEKEGASKCKAQGSEKSLQLLRDNPEWYKILHKNVSDLFGGS